MYLELNEPRMFRHIFESIKEHFTQYDLRFDRDGLHLQCMDVCKVAVFELFLSKEYFDKYETDYDIVISVDSESFTKACHIIQSDDKLIITNKDNDKLTFICQSEKRNISLKINQIMTDNEILDCDTFTPTHYFKMDNKTFSQHYTDLKHFESDNITFINNDNKEELSILGNSNDINIQIDCKNEHGAITFIRSTGVLNASYPLKYLAMINKLSPIFKIINLHMSSDYPIKINGNLVNDSWIRLIIAPKQ